jgi:cytoskeletal protein CcmA (bactofilin family)
MASIIKLKRNTSSGQVPSGGALQQGELAINLADKKLFSSSDGSDIIQISGDAYDLDTIANTTSGTIKLTGTGNAANSFVNITGANGIGITSDGSGAITITANTVDVDFGTSANTLSANLSVASGANTDVVKIVGDDHIVVAGTNTSHISVKLTNAVSVASVQTSGNTVVGGDVDITGEVNAASAAIRGAAVVTTTLAAGNTTLTGFINVSTTSQLDGLITGGAGLDLTGIANVSSDVNVGGDLDVTGAANVAGNFGVDGVVDIDDTTNSASTSTGSLVTAGGVGIAKSVQIGENLTVGQDIGARNITLSGNLTVQGTTTTVESTTVTINDNLLSLADNQTSADAVDIGFYGTFDDSGTDKYSAFFRDQDHTNKAFVLLEGITTEPGSTITYSASDLGQLDAVIDGGTY